SLPPMAKRRRLARIEMTGAQVRQRLLPGAAAVRRTQRGLEAATEERLVAIERGDTALVVLLLGAAQAHPPTLARRVDAFGAGRVEHLPCARGERVVLEQRDQHRSAAPRVAKMPATVCMAEASCRNGEQWRCQHARWRPLHDGRGRATIPTARRQSPTGRTAMTLDRRTFLTGTAALAATTVAAPYVHAQKHGGTLRFVPHADLKILDPIWTTA